MAAIAIQPILVSALLYLFLALVINNPAGCVARQENILYSNEGLETGEALRYGDDLFIMQEDCNLVLYHGGKPVWASNTGGLARNCHCRLLDSGNIAVYQGSRVIWSTRNRAVIGGRVVLVLQKDGNVVIYGPVQWSSNTPRGTRPINLRSDYREVGEISSS